MHQGEKNPTQPKVCQIIVYPSKIHSNCRCLHTITHFIFLQLFRYKQLKKTAVFRRSKKLAETQTYYFAVFSKVIQCIITFFSNNRPYVNICHRAAYISRTPQTFHLGLPSKVSIPTVYKLHCTLINQSEIIDME